jgi:hypothetical protein
MDVSEVDYSNRLTLFLALASQGQASALGISTRKTSLSDEKKTDYANKTRSQLPGTSLRRPVDTREEA